MLRILLVVQSRMIVQLGGRGSCRAAVPSKHTARQEPRSPGIRLHMEFAEIHDCTPCSWL